MKKFKISQTAQLGTVLTKEEMMQIQGNTSDDIENCLCKLHIAGIIEPVNGGTSNQKSREGCQTHCDAVCRTYNNCYSATIVYSATGSGSGSGTSLQF